MLMITLETTIIICIHLFNSQISGTVICFHLLQQLHLASLDISFRCTRIRAHMSYIYRILTEFYNRLEWQKHDTWHNCLQLSIFHFLCRLVLADDVISTRSSLCWRYFYLFGLWSCRIALSLRLDCISCSLDNIQHFQLLISTTNFPPFAFAASVVCRLETMSSSRCGG